MSDYNSHLTLQVIPADNKQHYQVVRFSGELDKAGLNLIKDQIEKLVDNFSLKYLVFDFADLHFINSECIGFLMAIYAHLVKAEKKLVVVQAPANIMDIFKVIGLSQVIDTYDSLPTFLEKNPL